MIDSTVERRLSALEHAVAKIQNRLTRQLPDPSRLDKAVGSMAGTEGFDEVVNYGRQFRHTDRLTD